MWDIDVDSLYLNKEFELDYKIPNRMVIDFLLNLGIVVGIMNYKKNELHVPIINIYRVLCMPGERTKRENIFYTIYKLRNATADEIAKEMRLETSSIRNLLKVMERERKIRVCRKRDVDNGRPQNVYEIIV